MSDKAFTSAELNAPRVVAALDENIAWRESERARLREEKIALYSRPRTFLGRDFTLTPEQATEKADKSLRELHGENADYFWHGCYIREMKVIRALAVGARDGTIRMSASDFQFVAKYYNDPSN